MCAVDAEIRIRQESVFTARTSFELVYERSINQSVGRSYVCLRAVKRHAYVKEAVSGLGAV